MAAAKPAKPAPAGPKVTREATAAPDAAGRRAGSRAAPFPIVGIGCSAGGLEALVKFFTNVPAHSGMGFVVVQHLDPAHASELPQLIQRITPLQVKEAGNRMRVKPDTVYIIPPNRTLSIERGVLHLAGPESAGDRQLAVDAFLRSLARDRGERAIGIILSGMGSDGVHGLRAIKENNGLTLVQTPGEAMADSMPRSAIDAGLADVVARVAELPARIVAYLHHPLPPAALAPPPSPASQDVLDRIVALLLDYTGSDFSQYKPSSLYRRIDRRTALHHLDGIAEYLGYLRNHPHEIELLFRELLIGVTSFFRDPAVWDFLSDEGIPALLARHPADRELRAWVPACSSGEEAYSLAIVFREAVKRARPDERVTLQIYATDLDEDAIERARKGYYPGNIRADVSPERLAHYFVPEGEGFRIDKDIRDMVVFAKQNVITDPPFTRLDILCCRNLLIYLRASQQKKLLPLFHYALNRGGLLVLGTAETVSEGGEMFPPVNNKLRVFRRNDQYPPISPLDLPARQSTKVAPASAADLPRDRGSLEYLTDQLIQQNFAPAAVLVNADGDIIYVSGQTGKYLEPAAGKVNINIHAMARPGLREALTNVIRSAVRHKLPVQLNDVPVGADGGRHMVNVTVQGLADYPEPLRDRVLVVFHDLPAPSASPRDGHVARRRKQPSVEHHGPANETLQSTNEELTTSNEELQSINEELQTVNAELQARLDGLTRVQNDLTNLLDSTRIAAVFLDNDLKLRRFTPNAAHLFELTPSDIGRPLPDLASDIDSRQLRDDATEVLRNLECLERQMAARDGRRYRVRIMPYRTLENVVDGVVIAFIDAGEITQLEMEAGGDLPPPDV